MAERVGLSTQLRIFRVLAATNWPTRPVSTVTAILLAILFAESRFPESMPLGGGDAQKGNGARFSRQFPELDMRHEKEASICPEASRNGLWHLGAAIAERFT